MLTKAYLLNKKQILPIIFNDSRLISDITKSFYLLIASTNPKFTKLTIYPILDKKILKIIVINKNKNQNELQEVIQIISKLCNIIHTSGLVFTPETLIYEVYIPENTIEVEKIIKQLKILDEKKNINIKIEKIQLKKKKKFF